MVHPGDINARRQGQPIYLWIDKLCINQDDLDEKAWQIRYMSKKIYSRAFKTLVWLGMDSTTNAPDTFEILASLEHLTHDQFLFEMKQLEFEARLENEKKLELVYIDPDCLLPTDSATPLVAKWTRLRSILSLPWWGRRWVIQEAFFSPVPIVTLSIADNGGSPAPDGVNSLRKFDGIHMDKFAQLAVWQEAYVSTNPCATQLIKTLFSSCPFYPLLRLWASFRMDASIHQDVLTWLEHTTSFNQTLDRDIVFALVSLSSANDQHKIIPDYESPDDYLFKRIFNYLVRHPRSPGVSQPFVISTQPRTFDLPSWCQAYWPSKPHLYPTMRFKGTELRPFKACQDRVNTANSTSTLITADALLPVHGPPL